MIIGHNKGTELPICARLLKPKMWTCIFEHEGQMRVGQSDAPIKSVAMLQTAAEALERIAEEDDAEISATRKLEGCKEIARATLERLNQ